MTLIFVCIQLGMASWAFMTLAGTPGLPWNIRAGSGLLSISMAATAALFIAEGGA